MNTAHGITLSDRMVAIADANRRATFVSRTYAHLTGAIFAFTLIQIVLFKSGLAERIAQALMGVSWLIVLGGFMVVGWMASHTAHRSMSMGAQYLALLGFVVAEAIIFVPLLYIANAFAPGTISSAAVVTFVGFGGLTAVAFVTRKDFSFLRGVLSWGFVVALVLIVASVLFGWNLGTWFSVGMVAFAGAAILYDTSNILRHYPEDRYVAAALELFASVALMFWYVLQLFLASRD
jgi:FtsH-binding integral membrane protein